MPNCITVDYYCQGKKHRETGALFSLLKIGTFHSIVIPVEQVEGEILLHYTDNEINQILSSQNAVEREYSRHYNQNEEFFVQFDEEFSVPSFPVHHDVKIKKPDDPYLTILREFLQGAVPLEKLP